MTGRIPGDGSTPLLVAYSGGKDSLVVMDLCVRAGRRVEAFMMSFLPGLDHAAYWCDYALRRWGVSVRVYQDPKTVQLLRCGRFRLDPAKIPAINTREIEAIARQETGCEWIGYGYKAVDSIDRRVMLKTWPAGVNEGWRKFAPLAGWRHADVLAYLSRRRIEIPIASKAGMSGHGLSPSSLAWMKTHWPGDYERVLKVFPFAEAQADRAEQIREWKQRARAERKAGARKAGIPVADQDGPLQPAVHL